MKTEGPEMRESGNQDGGIDQSSPEDKDFGDAFSEASKASESGDNQPELTPDAPPENPPVNPVDQSPQAPPDNQNRPEQKAGESDEAYEQRWKTLQGIYQKEKSDWSTEKAQLLGQIETFKKTSASAIPPQGTDTKDTGKKTSGLSIDELLTDDERSELKDYESDFETVSKMEGLKREKALEKLEKKLEELKDSIEQRLSGVDQRIAPVVQDIEEREVQEHLSVIRNAHSDFETYRDNGSIKKWIETQPKFMQASLLKAYQEGETQDVIDLISTFKQANNIPFTQPGSNSGSNVVALRSKREQKRQALQSVNSRNTPIGSSTNVASDFEGAFEEAARKG